jgi:HSP20 family molecular chaperone IbpA
MKCPNCGADVDEKWRFCPKCGARSGRRNLFDQLFSSFSKEMATMEKQMDKLMEKRFEAVDITPFFKPATKGRGFTIKIQRGAGMEPKVSVKTFGNVDKEKLAEQLRKQLHAKPGQPVRISLGPAAKAPAQRARPAPVPKPVKKVVVPEVTEEPKTSVRRVDSKVTVDMEMPGVKSESDISISEMQESVEVKAFAGKKAFFKILTKPAQFRLTSRKFRGGRLHLEFS